VSTPGNQVQQYAPRHPRATDFTDMVFQPGIASNASARDLKGRWVQSNRIRFHKGTAEKIGGWRVVPLVDSTGAQVTYIGVCRSACDWASLDSQQWIAFATESKLYLSNNGNLYDITPLRKESILTNPFSTTSGQPTVTVVDNDHRANQGDYMTVVTSATVGGFTLYGGYQITTVIDPNTYTITAATNATSTVTNGGGTVTIDYDISAGLAVNGQLYGYGTYEYGESTFGTPRPAGTGVPAKLRTWSLSNWGQDLVASYNNGEIYWWQWSNGPNTRAQLIANAPTDVQRILVNADAQFLIAVGSSDVTGGADPMNVRWCSESDLNDWLPVVLPVANTAGGQRLNYGSRMVAAIQSRQQNLLWSDTQMYQMPYLGEPNIFGFNELGKCFIVGPNAVVDVNGVVYMMCFDEFMIYDGTLRNLPCDMWETVFGPVGSINVGFDRSQAEMTYCSSYMTKSEVTWFYPASGTDIMHYVTYNYDENCWYGGTMPRTCYHDTSAALLGYLENPYAFNGGYLYLHEVGYDEVEATYTNPMYWFLQSWDAGLKSDLPMLINSVAPEFQLLRNGYQFSYLCKEYPQQATYQQIGPFIITPDTEKVDERASGTQVALLLEAAQVPNPAPALLLLHFDGVNGQTMTVDSSSYANAVSLNSGITLSTVAKEFGTAAIYSPPNNYFQSYCAAVPFAAGSLLDIFATNAWTIEFWFMIPAYSASNEADLISYGDTLNGGVSSCLCLQAYMNNDGATGSINAYDYSAFGTSETISATESMVPGTWHHVALVSSSGVAKLYYDGVAISATYTGWTPSHYSHTGSTNVVIGSFGRHSGATIGEYIDELRISGYAVYTANFTPPPQAFNGTLELVVVGQDFRMGVWQTKATPHGKRLAGAARGGNINTNNP
jgi:hypothetical protein